MIYLVTGGAGFIGSHLVRALLARGESVRILDNFSTGKKGNIEAAVAEAEMTLSGVIWVKAERMPVGPLPTPRLLIVEGDIRNPEVCRHVTDGVRYVLHHAELPSVARSIEDPETTYQVNAGGTLNLLIAARDARVARFVYASSCAVYGDNPVLPLTETMPLAPLSPYAASKVAGEAYCRVFHQSYGLETVVLRHFNVFGPRQDSSSPYAAAIPKIAAALRSGEPPTIYGDGEQTRDFTYVDDCVQVSLLACAVPDAKGEVINVATGRRTSVNQLVVMVTEALRKQGAIPQRASTVPHRTAPRPGDVMHCLADITKAAKFLGYQPQWSLAEGILNAVRA